MSYHHQGNSYPFLSATEGAKSERQPDLISGAFTSDGFAFHRNIDVGSEQYQQHRIDEKIVVEKVDSTEHMYQ